MQTTLNFFDKDEPGKPVPKFSTGAPVADNLRNFISVCGLVAFKDHYMKIKNGQIDNVPEGMTRNQYLILAKEIYEERANAVERHNTRIRTRRKFTPKKRR